MDEFLNDQEVALVLTVVRLAGKQATPLAVQQEYQRAKAEVADARKYPDMYPEIRRRNTF